MKETLVNWLNSALMLNLFFVLFSFAWLAIALVGKSLHLPFGFDLWYSLWQPVFMPALGILMAGALLSGAIGWISQRLNLTASR
ncbi:hypothetical protein H6F67_03655 [Microcoleus sp. FACHB-1515]|uniref:hypothetical protein n=1 Tax=Cyanophyceae TaxID=3028117 RepID=UPI001689B042|nr:hypothetical protein [Microcoleus sp. FACHB-1515]MBD2088947.1 hypothetical protein [Microcoleus sp. FACHB-1515]